MGCRHKTHTVVCPEMANRIDQTVTRLYVTGYHDTDSAGTDHLPQVVLGHTEQIEITMRAWLDREISDHLLGHVAERIVNGSVSYLQER